MTNNKLLKTFYIFFVILSILVTTLLPVFAIETEPETNGFSDYRCVAIIAEVAENYPQNYVDATLKNDKGEKIQDIRFTKVEMYKKLISLPPGNYVLTGKDPVDEKNFPIETISFTVKHDAMVRRFTVGIKEDPSDVSTTTETPVDTVEKENEINDTLPERDPAQSIVTETKNDNSNMVSKNTDKINRYITVIVICSFLLIVVITIIILFIKKNKNKNFN